MEGGPGFFREIGGIVNVYSPKYLDNRKEAVLNEKIFR